MTAINAQRAELWQEVSALLYHEATLLDESRFRDWLELYTEDATYWVPQGPREDPDRIVSISYDDRRRLEERVLRLEGGFAYAQDPRSRTCHIVGNVVPEETGEGIRVESSLAVAEVRRGSQCIYAGRVEHDLVRADGGLRIRGKVVRLVNSDLPLGNVSFLL